MSVSAPAPAPDPRSRFRRLLAEERCWDAEVQRVFEAKGEPLQDCILQDREELIALCEFMQAHRVRSYLEIGLWTGRLLSVLDRLFELEPLAGCDHGWAAELGLPIRVPPRARVFWGDSESPAYRLWREQLGPIDLVLIDANHSYRGVRRDFEINRAFPHRFLAFHDITGASRQTAGVGRFWRELREGHKLELVRPELDAGGRGSPMGIGIWSQEPLGSSRSEDESVTSSEKGGWSPCRER